ncbi:hypothetical protein CHUAL_008320 [Chamberlinius hualienensis]
MELKQSTKLSLMTLCLLAIISGVYTYRCCSSTASCTWSGDWESSPPGAPYTTIDYPNFWRTAPDTGFAVLLDIISDPIDSWSSKSIVCDESVAFCCGVGHYPCTGIIKFRSYIDLNIPEALYAFGDVCVY